jgi:PAS domain S-box
MFKKNIVFKLTAGYILIVLISTLSIGLLFINVFKNYTIENRQKNMLQKANEISGMVEPYLSSSQNLSNYNDTFKLIDSSVNARVWIADKNGTILGMSNSGPGKNTGYGSLNANQFDKELIAEILSGKDAVREEYNNFYEETMLSVGVPIRSSANSIEGMVLLHSPMSGITSIVDRVFNATALTIVFEIILCGLLGFYFSKSIAKPLKLMNKSAIEMTNGNYKVLTNIYQKDEIGQLGSSLDMLALKLDYTINQLFQEKNKLNDLFLSMSEGILAFDLDMNLINHNESVRNVLGYGLIDLDAAKLKQDLERYGLLSDFQSVIMDGQKKIIVKNWESRVLRFSVSPVKSSQNEIAGVVVLVQDISEQERLEQMRKDFIANVSHEFRTPLTLIKGSLESMIDGVVPDGEVFDYYNRLLDETNRLQRMVNDLLSLSRLQSGKVNLSFEELDLTSLISDVSRTMQFIADKKNIKIELNLVQNMPPVYSDYDKLKQLLIIFIDNSIKYSHENSKILVSTNIGDHAYIEIEDNGIGIPKEDIPYIWDRFYKVDKSRDDNKTGTGLGLAIAKYLIDLLNSTINIESELGRGTKIRIGLPLTGEVLL